MQNQCELLMKLNMVVSWCLMCWVDCRTPVGLVGTSKILNQFNFEDFGLSSWVPSRTVTRRRDDDSGWFVEKVHIENIKSSDGGKTLYSWHSRSLKSGSEWFKHEDIAHICLVGKKQRLMFCCTIKHVFTHFYICHNHLNLQSGPLTGLNVYPALEKGKSSWGVFRVLWYESETIRNQSLAELLHQIIDSDLTEVLTAYLST